ncbi:MAG: hypothetical protein WDW38_010206 [Sanguina aurantia]
MKAPSLLLKLQGHRDSVNCCAASAQQPHVLASGSEDGRVCLFDLNTGQLSHTLLRPNPHPTPPTASPPATSDGNIADSPSQSLPDLDHPPIAALAFWPCSQPSPSASSLSNPSPPHSTPGVLYAACGKDILCLDPRAGRNPASRYSHSRDDVAAIALSTRGSHLAAGDDAGEVLIVDLVAGRPFKHMRSVHPAGMVTSVAFSGRRQWEVVTGGTDSCVARYDYSRARCLDRWPMGQLSQPILAPVSASRTAGAAAGVGQARDADGLGGGDRASGVEGAAEDGTAGQLFNPPFVHQLALAGPDVSCCGGGGGSGGGGGGSSGGRLQRQLAAVARGDGAVALFDINTQSSLVLAGGSPVVNASAAKLSRSQVKAGTAAPTSAAAAAPGKGRQSAGSSGGMRGKSRTVGAGSNGSTKALHTDPASANQTQDGSVVSSQRDGLGGMDVRLSGSASLQQDVPRHLYHHTLLGRGAGGHRRAACCVCFSSITHSTNHGSGSCSCGLAACGNNLPVLYSAGEDKRVLCWNAARATTGLGLQGGEGREGAGEGEVKGLLLCEHLHPRKVNDLCVVPWGSGREVQADDVRDGGVAGELLVVADTGKRVSVYLVTH